MLLFAGLLPVGDSIVYAATKHGVVGMSRSAAVGWEVLSFKVEKTLYFDFPIKQ